MKLDWLIFHFCICTTTFNTQRISFSVPCSSLSWSIIVLFIYSCRPSISLLVLLIRSVNPIVLLHAPIDFDLTWLYFLSITIYFLVLRLRPYISVLFQMSAFLVWSLFYFFYFCVMFMVVIIWTSILIQSWQISCNLSFLWSVSLFPLFEVSFLAMRGDNDQKYLRKRSYENIWTQKGWEWRA